MNNKWKNNISKPLSLKEQINDDGTLTIMRTGKLGMSAEKNGISFYGLSKWGIKCYATNEPGYHRWKLPKDLVDKIVDLHTPDNIKLIKSLKKTYPELNETLFINNNKANRRNELCRKSDDSKIDRDMVSKLKSIFPEKIGSYTQKGKFLHSEIIIWDSEINEALHDQKYNHEYISEALAPPPIRGPKRQSNEYPSRYGKRQQLQQPQFDFLNNNKFLSTGNANLGVHNFNISGELGGGYKKKKRTIKKKKRKMNKRRTKRMKKKI